MGYIISIFYRPIKNLKRGHDEPIILGDLTIVDPVTGWIKTI